MTTATRRKWLKSLLPQAVDAVARTIEERVEQVLPAQRRPPGATSESVFLSLCTRCDKCVEACPHAAVHRFAEGTGLLAGTPVMRPDQRACHMCEGFPCAAACPEGALVMPEAETWPLGKVRLIKERCIAFMGPECGACVGLCPDGVTALRQRNWRPELDADDCVGCGLCLEACPTWPKALALEPLEPKIG